MVASGMTPLLSIATILAALGCRSVASPAPGPAPAEAIAAVVVVPGAPAACRASWVFAAPPPPDAREHEPFRQVAGVLHGASFGACTLMGPTEEGGWLWVLMSFEPGYRGALSCTVEESVSPHLQVGPPQLALPAGIKAKFLQMDPELAIARVIPTESIPCVLE